MARTKRLSHFNRGVLNFSTRRYIGIPKTIFCATLFCAAAMYVAISFFTLSNCVFFDGVALLYLVVPSCVSLCIAVGLIVRAFVKACGNKVVGLVGFIAGLPEGFIAGFPEVVVL